MRVTSIEVGYDRTFNLGDYNNIRAGIRLSAELDEGDDPDEMAKALYEMASNRVKEEVKPLLIAKGVLPPPDQS